MLRILHVEDDENDLLLVRSALKKARLPVSIEAVTSGRQAIQYFEDRLETAEAGPLPDLLLLDLKLPGLDGFGVLESLHGEQRLRNMQVYVLTSSDLPCDRSTALRLGASKYLVKSPDFKDVVGSVAELVALAGEDGPAGN